MGISTLKWHIEHSPTRRYTVCLLHRQGNTIPYSVLALNLFQKFFRKKPVRDLLPTKPAVLKVLEPWWIVQIGYVTEDDIRVRRKRSFQYNLYIREDWSFGELLLVCDFFMMLNLKR